MGHATLTLGHGEHVLHANSFLNLCQKLQFIPQSGPKIAIHSFGPDQKSQFIPFRMFVVPQIDSKGLSNFSNFLPKSNNVTEKPLGVWLL